MSVEITQEHGHYSMYIDEEFYGNYDTFTEAVQDLETLEKEKEGAA